MNKFAIERIKKFFANNPDIFNVCLEQLDSYKGYLDDDRYYEMDEFDNLCRGLTPTQIATALYYGYDADSWKVEAPFCPNRKYFAINVLGNFVSTDNKDYSGYLDDRVIVEMNDAREYLDEIYEHDELLELFNELD